MWSEVANNGHIEDFPVEVFFEVCMMSFHGLLCVLVIWVTSFAHHLMNISTSNILAHIINSSRLSALQKSYTWGCPAAWSHGQSLASFGHGRSKAGSFMTCSTLGADCGSGGTAVEAMIGPSLPAQGHRLELGCCAGTACNGPRGAGDTPQQAHHAPDPVEAAGPLEELAFFI